MVQMIHQKLRLLFHHTLNIMADRDPLVQLNRNRNYYFTIV
jgi:hypothetical protein